MISHLRTLVAAAFVLLCVKNASAQIALQNQLPCDVTVFIEMRIAPQCGPACWGQAFVIPANSSINVVPCPGYSDLCIFVTQIGSCAVNGTHLTQWCHGTVLVDNGISPAGCCMPAPVGWTATWNPVTNQFIIQ